MNRGGYFIIALIAGMVLLGCHRPASAAGSLDIDSDRDSRFLPYAADTLRTWPGSAASTGRRWIHVWRRAVRPATEVLCVEGVNQQHHLPLPCAVNLRAIDAANGDVRTIWERPLKGRIAEVVTFGGADDPDGCVLTGVVRSDSAWLVRLSRFGEVQGELFLGTGTDRNGNGVWDGQIEHLLTADYDMDGDAEVFLFLTGLRDLAPRSLICVDATSLAIKWTLPVASEIAPGRLFALPDSSNPAIVFTTSNPAQGASDDNFSDQFSYLARVNGAGEIDFKYIVGRYPEPGRAVSDPMGRVLYVFHRLPFLYDTASAARAEPLSSLLRLSLDGHPLATIEIDDVVVDLILHTGPMTPPYLYAITGSGEVRRYDTTLRLVDVAPVTPWQHVLQTGLKVDGQAPGFLVAEQAGGVFLYSEQFRRLAYLGSGQSYEAMQVDSTGNVLALLSTSRTEGHTVYRLRQRDLAAMVSIWYRAYQQYVVAAVAGLLVAIVLVNYFRLRTRSTLKLVAAQKRELQETHEALKRAQAQIVVAEKYRQARDIAGGFAHEIRNALFPARGMLAKLRAEAAEAKVRNLLSTADESVGRAIEITKIISMYAELETKTAPQAVSVSRAVTEAVEALQYRLDGAGVRPRVDGPPDAHVLANHEQLVVVLGNLLRNSIDALASRFAPTIRVSWERADQNVNIRVQDNGEGIPPEHAAHIFNAFYSTRPETGTGLGLTIVKKIVSMHAGHVDVQSTPGEGTTVTMTLPAAHAAAADLVLKESTP